MASPFHVFRKNQKAMIATLGLLAIGAFVFLTPIAMYYSGSSAKEGEEAENPVVVTTTQYGDLTARDIRTMQTQQQGLFSIFRDVIRMCPSGMSPNQDLRQSTVAQLFGNTSEERVVRDWLLAKRAKEVGMQISDESIDEFILSMFYGKVDPQAFSKILTRYGFPEDLLYQMLQDKLVANKMFADSFGMSLFPMNPNASFANWPRQYYFGTPGQCWDYFQRVNRKVELQATGVDVEDYKKEIAKPTEKQLAELFEKYKSKPENAFLAEPGFLVPEKVEIEYIEADPEVFGKAEAVTDEEVKEYYENHKYKYIREEALGTSTGGLPEVNKEDPKIPVVEPEKKALPEDVLPEPEKSVLPEKKDDASPEKSAEEAPKTSDATRSRFHLVSMQADTNEAKKEIASEKGGETKPVEDAKPATDANPAIDNKPIEDVKPEPQMPALPIGDDSNPSMLGTLSGDLDRSEKTPEKEEDIYKSLEEVEEEIREDLAWDRAKERARKSLEEVRKEIKAYRLKRIKGGNKIPPFDMKKKTEEHKGWSHGATGLKSVGELLDTEVGVSRNDDYKPIVSIVFDKLYEHKLEISEGRDKTEDGKKVKVKGKVYLLWKINQTKEKVSSLEDPETRKKVEAAFVQKKALEKAREEAERLAKVARKSGRWLSNSLAEQEAVTVRTSDYFTWFRETGVVSPNGVPQLRVTEKVVHVDRSKAGNVIEDVIDGYVGPDFMRTVYGLGVNEIAVVTNYSKDHVYVVQLISTEPDTKELLRGYQKVLQKGGPFGSYFVASQPDVGEAIIAWYKQIEEEAGLEWKRSPAPYDPER